jgi:hypothetical protein
MSDNAQQLRERIIVVREELSNTLFGIINPLRGDSGFSYFWNEDEAVRKAKILSRFYKELIDGGIDKEMAWQLTQKFLVLPDELIKEYYLKSLDIAKDIASLVVGENKTKP